MTYATVWFMAQAIVAYALWNMLVADAIGADPMSFLEVLGVYGLLRLVISPPKLTLEWDN